MKSLAVSVLTAAVLISVFSVGSRGQAPSEQTHAAPWQVGQCYRVFPADATAIHTFKVLEAPRGQWIRVLQQPSLETVIGAQAPLWINIDAPFAVQEWKCSR